MNFVEPTTESYLKKADQLVADYEAKINTGVADRVKVLLLQSEKLQKLLQIETNEKSKAND